MDEDMPWSTSGIDIFLWLVLNNVFFTNLLSKIEDEEM